MFVFFSGRLVVVVVFVVVVVVIYAYIFTELFLSSSEYSSPEVGQPLHLYTRSSSYLEMDSWLQGI